MIWFYDTGTGEQEELLVNEIGSYSGSTLIGVTEGYSRGVSPGEYVLEVTVSGSWQVNIEQLNPSATPQPSTDVL